MKIAPELVAAYEELARARQQLIHYRQVDLPARRRQLDQADRLNLIQMRILERRLADYRPFLAVGQYSPVRTAAENDWLALQTAREERLNLQDEEIALMRFGGESELPYQLAVLQAMLRVRTELGNAPIAQAP